MRLLKYIKVNRAPLADGVAGTGVMKLGPGARSVQGLFIHYPTINAGHFGLCIGYHRITICSLKDTMSCPRGRRY